MEKHDIHNTESRYKQTIRRIREADIPKENKERILEFLRDTSSEGAELRRLDKLGNNLVVIARRYNKPFEEYTEDDLKEFLTGIKEGLITYQRKKKAKDKKGQVISIPYGEKMRYKVRSQEDYCKSIRQFWKWDYYRAHPEERIKPLRYLQSPRIVAWVRTPKKSEKTKIQDADIPTTKEITKLIKACKLRSHRALIAFLADTGARIEEAINVRIKHLEWEEEAVEVTFPISKTVSRKVLSVSAYPYLAEWLSIHPERDNPEAIVFVPELMPNKSGVKEYKYKGMCYQTANKLVKKASKEAGIKKTITPHRLRHYSVTSFLRQGATFALAEKRFGTSPTKLADTYAHLVYEDANNKMREIHGLKTEKKHKKGEYTKDGEIIHICRKCPFCSTPNTNEAVTCVKCSKPLDEHEALKYKKNMNMMEQLVQRMDVQESMIRSLFEEYKAKHNRGELPQEFYKKS